MTFGQFFVFNDFTMTIFIFQIFQSPWEPCLGLRQHSLVYRERVY